MASEVKWHRLSFLREILTKPHVRLPTHDKTTIYVLKIVTTCCVVFSIAFEHFLCFKYLRNVSLYLLLHWVASFVFVIIAYLTKYGKNSLKDGAESPKKSIFQSLPFIVLYVLTMYVKESDMASQVTSQGPPAYVVNLCLSPLIVTASLTCLKHHTPQTSWPSIITVTYSGMMLMTICDDEGSCYFSFKDALFNFGFTALYAIFFIKLEQNLTEDSVVHLARKLCTYSALLMPLFILISPETSLMWNKPHLLINFFNPTKLLPLIFLKLFQMVSCLLQIKLMGVTSHVMTRNLAWIPSCLMVVFGFKLELLVSSFKAFFISGVSFLLYFIPGGTDVGLNNEQHRIF